MITFQNGLPDKGVFLATFRGAIRLRPQAHPYGAACGSRFSGPPGQLYIRGLTIH